MPHFGLIDESIHGPDEAMLMRARLHIRCGSRRLREGKLSYGIITIYDALLSGMQWYISSHERMNGLAINKGDDLNNDRVLFDILRRSGVVDRAFDYDAFDKLVEMSLDDLDLIFNYEETLGSFNNVMTQLGIMPFDENELPPEDPSTL